MMYRKRVAMVAKWQRKRAFCYFRVCKTPVFILSWGSIHQEDLYRIGFRAATVGIETVVVVYFVAGEGDDIPSTEVAHTTGYVAKAAHPGGDVARADGNAAATVGGDGGKDVCRVVKLACLALVGMAEEGLDKLLHHVGLFEVGIVFVERSHLVGIEPVLEALAVEAVGLRIEPLIGDGVGIG